MGVLSLIDATCVSGKSTRTKERDPMVTAWRETQNEMIRWKKMSKLRSIVSPVFRADDDLLLEFDCWRCNDVSEIKNKLLKGTRSLKQGLESSWSWVFDDDQAAEVENLTRE